jgi:flagellar motility protein MotE (MotC chaperone)
MLHVVWFGGWIVWNLGWIPGLAPFDPFPFGLLTMVVSLEAIFLSAFILLSQNRQSDVSDLRGEINLTLNMVSDEKNSAILRTLTKMARQMEMEEVIDEGTGDLAQPLDYAALERELRAEVERPAYRPAGLDMVLLRVRRALARDDVDEAVAIIESMRPADQADVVADLELEEQAELLVKLPAEESADIMEELEDEEAAKVAARLASDDLARILEKMEPDEAADVLGDMSEEGREEALSKMAPEEAEDVRPLLVHPDESAGGLMTSEYVSLKADSTAHDALEEVKKLSEGAEESHYVFVTEENGKLVGVISLQRLLKAAPTALLKDIMDDKVVAVTATAKPEECRAIIARYDYFSLPVTDEDGRLLGVIMADDLMEER